jgi:hypothetical protein
MIRRLLVIAGACTSAAIVSLSGALLATPAWAGQQTGQPGPVFSVQISADSLAEPIVFAADREPQLFAVVNTEVAWLANIPTVASSPAADKLGAKYTVLVLANGKPIQTYDLYPNAAGGPRVFRPAEQPDQRQVGAGWFYGRLSMPTTLANVGVSLSGSPSDPGTANGGGGGGSVAVAPTGNPDFGTVLGDWTRFTGLNSALIIVIAAGIFVLAFMLRKQGR